MKQEEQRIAIAEACGWSGPFTPYHWGQLLGIKWIDGAVHQRVPDYLNDLNAMHEAEKVLIANGADSAAFNDILDAICMDDWLAEKQQSPRPVHSTAAQRAEAFLKTLNLWKP